MERGAERAAPEPAQSSRRDAIAQALNDGKSYGQIAKQFGISRGAVAGTIRDMGLKGYGQGWKPARLTDEQARAREKPEGKIDPTSDEQRFLRLKQIRRILTDAEREDLEALHERFAKSAEPDYDFTTGYRHRADGGRVDGELPEASKHTHEEVGYVPQSPHAKQRCAACWKFIKADDGGPGCLKVRDPIEGGGWCRRFSRTKP